MKFEKLPAIEAKHVGCLNCGGNEQLAPLDMVIAVGFGSAYASKDGEMIYEEPNYNDPKMKDENYKTVADIEAIAAKDPDHDYRIVKYAPLKEGEWQRQGEKRWVLIREGQGFA